MSALPAANLRDANDPLEQEVIDQFGIEIVPAADVKGKLPSVFRCY